VFFIKNQVNSVKCIKISLGAWLFFGSFSYLIFETWVQMFILIKDAGDVR